MKARSDFLSTLDVEMTRAVSTAHADIMFDFLRVASNETVDGSPGSSLCDALAAGGDPAGYSSRNSAVHDALGLSHNQTTNFYDPVQ